MKVSDILEIKGPSVKTIKPTETVGRLARQLQQNRIGAMVVSSDGQTIDGISERDIAYSLADRRGELHLLPVSSLMTRNVITCTPEAGLAEIMGQMMRHRIRHLPVKKRSPVDRHNQHSGRARISLGRNGKKIEAFDELAVGLRMNETVLAVAVSDQMC